MQHMDGMFINYFTTIPFSDYDCNLRRPCVPATSLSEIQRLLIHVKPFEISLQVRNLKNMYLYKMYVE